MGNKQICFYVGAESCDESNLFLRKFYDEISKSYKMGWEYSPYREEKRVYIGHSNFGEVYFDYKECGKINNIYVSVKENDERVVKTALETAKKDYRNSQKVYTVVINMECDGVYFANMAMSNISVSYDDVNKANYISFSVLAFGEYDCKYVVMQKVNYLKHILCAFTNFLFDIGSIKISEGQYQCENVVWSDYDTGWIDTSDIIKNESRMVLLPEFFMIMRQVLDNFNCKNELRLILNSAQQLYCAKLLIEQFYSDEKYIIPGYTDLIDTTLVSALEPISNIGALPVETCSECGQLKYSIRKKVLAMCRKYFSEEFVKKNIDKMYADRSAFLHEGTPKTNEFYTGVCVPLIDYRDGRSISLPVSIFNWNLFEYVSFVIRNVIIEYLKT